MERLFCGEDPRAEFARSAAVWRLETSVHRQGRTIIFRTSYIHSSVSGSLPPEPHLEDVWSPPACRSACCARFALGDLPHYFRSIQPIVIDWTPVESASRPRSALRRPEIRVVHSSVRPSRLTVGTGAVRYRSWLSIGRHYPCWLQPSIRAVPAPRRGGRLASAYLQ